MKNYTKIVTVAFFYFLFYYVWSSIALRNLTRVESAKFVARSDHILIYALQKWEQFSVE